MMQRRRAVPIRRSPPPRRKVPTSRDGELHPMTICIAAMYRHAYGPKIPEDVGTAILTASDRMWTNMTVGIEYEPGGQGKYGNITPTVMVLVADEIDIHTEVLRLIRPFANQSPQPATYEIAHKYGELLSSIKSDRAIKFALGSNYGFTAEQFANLQKSMDSNVVARLDQDIQRYEEQTGAEAIITGVDSDATSHIYHVDRHGIVRPYDDIGFLCIGAGKNQANAQFAQHSYSNLWTYYPALLMVYGAKKAAESAPGVGPTTDMYQILRDQSWRVMPDALMAKPIQNIYAKYMKKIRDLEGKAARELLETEQKLMKLIEDDAKGASSAGQTSHAALDQSSLSEAQTSEKTSETPPPTRPAGR